MYTTGCGSTWSPKKGSFQTIRSPKWLTWVGWNSTWGLYIQIPWTACNRIARFMKRPHCFVQPKDSYGSIYSNLVWINWYGLTLLDMNAFAQAPAHNPFVSNHQKHHSSYKANVDGPTKFCQKQLRLWAVCYLNHPQNGRIAAPPIKRCRKASFTTISGSELTNLCIESFWGSGPGAMNGLWFLIG